jgi:hypothetical protein
MRRRGEMAELAIALPCLPGGADELRQLAKECSGPRKEEFEDFHRRVGLTSERWYLQQTPQGELHIVVLEGDPAGAIGALASSDNKFDQWFRERIKAVHGVDFSQPLPGPPPEQVFAG